MNGFIANIGDNETTYIFLNVPKISRIVFIFFKQALELDASKVLAKFKRVSYVRF